MISGLFWKFWYFFKISNKITDIYYYENPGYKNQACLRHFIASLFPQWYRVANFRYLRIDWTLHFLHNLMIFGTKTTNFSECFNTGYLTTEWCAKGMHIFWFFFKFFISDQIYTPKIMTNNLSHVLTSWLYTKKVCDMHALCTPRHMKSPVCD